MPKVGRSLSFSPTSIPFARAVLKLKYRNRPLAHYQTPVPHGRPEPDPVVDTPPPNPTACVALQNEDFVEDAVIITSLSAVPFCCHEDLLTMSRPGLIGVAEALNDKLPAALRISTNRTRTDAAIRNEIEFIVGLRANKGAEDGSGKSSKERYQTPPTSPTPASPHARKRALKGHGTPRTPLLERLEEEHEEEEEGTPTRSSRPSHPIPDARRSKNRAARCCAQDNPFVTAAEVQEVGSSVGFVAPPTTPSNSGKL